VERFPEKEKEKREKSIRKSGMVDVKIYKILLKTKTGRLRRKRKTRFINGCFF